MRIETTFLVLLCSVIWECIGAPLEEVGVGSSRVKYTLDEDQFIIDELSNMFDDTIPLYNEAQWKTLAEKYKQKSRQGNPGFASERSANSLLDRFRKVLIHNHPRHEVKVPQELMQKMMKSSYLKKAETGSKKPWTKEENDFVIEELSKPTYSSLLSKSTYEAIRAEHDRKREAGTYGFRNVRNKEGIHSHLIKMRRGGQIPREVLEKLEPREKVVKHPYNKYEDNFIIEELSKPSCTGLFSTSTLNALCTEHNKKRKAATHGFKNKRTVSAIRTRLSTMKQSGLLPNELLEKFHMGHKDVSGASTSKSLTQNQENDLQVRNEGQDEDDWIADMVEELQNNSDFEIDFSNLESVADE